MSNKKQVKTSKEFPKNDQPKEALVKPEPKPEPKAESKPEPKHEPKTDNKAVFPMKDFKEKEEFKEEVEETLEKKYFLMRREVILSLVFLLFLIGLAGGGYWVYRNSFQQKQTEDADKIFSSPDSSMIDESKEATSSVEAVIATQSAEATLSGQIKQSNLIVKVLNGNGQKGSANKAKVYLESLGYEKVQTGNAGAYDYEKTEIEIKESKEEYLKMLEDDFSDEYELASSSANLDENSAFDALVIIGGGQEE